MSFIYRKLGRDLISYLEAADQFAFDQYKASLTYRKSIAVAPSLANKPQRILFQQKLGWIRMFSAALSGDLFPYWRSRPRGHCRQQGPSNRQMPF